MDSSNLLLTAAAGAPLPLGHLSTGFFPRPLSQLQGNEPGDEQNKRIAKDFESLLLARLLDEMAEGIGNFGFDKDGPSRQVQGIFWMYLARDIADSGGLGLWKDIYKFMTDAEGPKPNTETQSLDKKL